jgi:biotin carboxylase
VTKPHIVFVEMSGTGAGEQCLLYSAERGYRTTLLTRSPDRDDLPDVPVDVVGCETNDAAAVVACVEGLDRRHRVGGVTTTHDLYTPQAAAAAEALGLPGIRYDAVVGVRDKHRMRMTLEQHCPRLNPPFRHVRSLDEALAVADEWGFPFVAKPLDANDSWGVELVESRDALIAYMDATERWEFDPEQELASGVLLEGLLQGSEHTIDTIQHKGGPLQLMCSTGKEMPPGRFFAEANCFLPVEPELSELLFREVATALEALEIDCGAVHSECRVHDGEVKILEVNPRLGGDMLGSHMIEAAYGASPIEQVVEIALGHDARWRPTRAQGACLYGITVPSSGIFGGVRNLDEILRQEGVIGARVYASPGTECRFPPRSNGDFVGRVVALGPTAEVALERARRAAGAADVVMRDAVTA